MRLEERRVHCKLLASSVVRRFRNGGLGTDVRTEAQVFVLRKGPHRPPGHAHKAGRGVVGLSINFHGEPQIA
jgi:hypothetical protein